MIAFSLRCMDHCIASGEWNSRGEALVSGRAPESGVKTWIALRRAHRGGVTNLAGQWYDSGRPVPGHVADALDELTSGGLLALGDDLEPGERRRVTVTDRGSARYLELCQVHNPGRSRPLSGPRRWAPSPHDQRSHLLAEREAGFLGDLVAVCGQRMPWLVHSSAQPTARPCPTCAALAALPAPTPQGPDIPDAEPPPVAPAPGRRPDTTASAAPGRRVPAPRFGTETPAGRRSSSPAPLPAPGGQPDPSHRAGCSSVGRSPWACSGDGDENAVVRFRRYLVRVLTPPGDR
jgi:hypothetical protein